jgi:hypothetical protein
MMQSHAYCRRRRVGQRRVLWPSLEVRVIRASGRDRLMLAIAYFGALRVSEAGLRYAMLRAIP